MFSLRLQPVLSFSPNRSRGRASSAERRARWPWPMRRSRSPLEITGVVVLTEHLLQHKYLLADARVCSRALEELGHELVAALPGFSQCINCFRPAAPAAGLSR